MLTQIEPGNVKNLELKWILPNQAFGAWQSTPLVVNGIMYVTQRPNDVLAVDAKTGRVFWQYHYTVSPDARVCCGANNRGVAILGDIVYTGTLDGHLVALDATTGRPLWNIAVGDPKLGYSITMAPLIVKDKVLVGVGMRHPRLRRRIRCANRKADVAHLHDSRSRRARPRHVER